MTTITIPVSPPITKKEVRCDVFQCLNNLDVALDQPALKYNATIQRILEPQTAAGVRVGNRESVAPLALNMSALLAENFTSDGMTLTGAQVLGFVCAVIDAHKGDGLV